MTVRESRKNPFELLVTVGLALRAATFSAKSETSSSVGEFYWDDGNSIFDDIEKHTFWHWNFEFSQTASQATLKLTSSGTTTATALPIPTLDVIEVLGYSHYPDFTSFTLDGKKLNVNVQLSSYNAFKQILFISTPNLIDMSSVAGTSVLQWRHANSVE